MFVETKREGEIETKLEPWQQLLLDAADYIEKHGHCIGHYANEQGNVCMMGAIHRTMRSEGDANDAVDILCDRIGRGVVDFNDAHNI